MKYVMVFLAGVIVAQLLPAVAQTSPDMWRQREITALESMARSLQRMERKFP